ADGVGGAVGDVGDADGLVAVEAAVERLVLVAGVIGIGGVVHPPAQGADVTAHGLGGEERRRGGGGGRVAAVVDVDELRAGVAGADVGLDGGAPRGVVGRVG